MVTPKWCDNSWYSGALPKQEREKVTGCLGNPKYHKIIMVTMRVIFSIFRMVMLIVDKNPHLWMELEAMYSCWRQM